MSYTPINWQTGDTITAEKLNKMDNGWSVSTGASTILEETVTTAWDGFGNLGVFQYTSHITADTVTVTYDNSEYVCSVIYAGDGTAYGGMGEMGPDFSDYPFVIISNTNGNAIYTETVGTHSVKIEAVGVTVETSTNFQTAVRSFNGAGIFIAIKEQTTWQEIYDAISAGKSVYVRDSDTDSVSLYPVITADVGSNVYEISALFINGGTAAARYYNANSANSPIYSA